MATIDLKLKSYDELSFEIMRLNTDNYLKQQEIDRLNNIINELEKWLIDETEKLHNISGDNFTTVGQKVYQEVLNKLKKIKEYK